MAERDDRSTGRFETRKAAGPAVEVDCAGWGDTSAGWTFGRFETRKATGPAVEVDCAGWGGASAVWLEVTVAFTNRPDNAALAELSKRLVGALQNAAPGLGLVQNEMRSRMDGGDMVIALSPTSTEAADEQLAGLIPVVRSILGGPAPHPARVSAGVCWAA